MTIVETAEVASPIGRITLAVRDGGLCALDFTERWPRRRAALEKRFGQVEFRRATDPEGMVTRLERYFAGDLGALASVRVDPGGTVFQRRVAFPFCTTTASECRATVGQMCQGTP